MLFPIFGVSGDSLDSQSVALVFPLEEQLVDVLLPVEQRGVDQLSVEQPGAPAEDDDEAEQHYKVRTHLVTGDNSQKRKMILSS